MQVSVSVVMPCFRCAGCVADAVDSVRAQTASPLELIAVDDASDDATPQVLRALQDIHGDGWLRIIRIARNSGPAAARNVGWNAAKGEYVAFIDADDTWHPRKLEIQHAWMASNPLVGVSAHDSMLLPRGRAPAEVPDNPAVRFPSPRSYLLKNPFITPAVMLRRELPFRFREGRRHMEDHLLWQTMSLAGERIGVLSASLAAIHKAPFGEGGLSADLFAMECGELANYWVLRGEGLISLPTALALCAYSLLKFIRRLGVVAVRLAARKT